MPQGLGFTEPGRQIFHCTFGSVLTDADLGPAVRQVLESHQDTYTEVLADHFGRHLDALRDLTRAPVRVTEALTCLETRFGFL